MLVREARDAELDQVVALMTEAYGEYAAGLPDGAWEMYAADIADVRGRLGHSRLIVCEDGGELAGAVTFYPPGGFELVPQSFAYFRLLAVSPARRGRGVGRALVEETIARARTYGAEWLAIHTTPAMAAGTALYQSVGFVRYPGLDIEPPGFEMPDGSPIRVLAYRLELTGGGSVRSAM